MTWFLENMGTIVTLLIVIAIVCTITYSLVRNARKGKSSCGCHCSSCPMGGVCHQQKSPKLIK